MSSIAHELLLSRIHLPTLSSSVSPCPPSYHLSFSPLRALSHCRPAGYTPNLPWMRAVATMYLLPGMSSNVHQLLTSRRTQIMVNEPAERRRGHLTALHLSALSNEVALTVTCCMWPLHRVTDGGKLSRKRVKARTCSRRETSLHFITPSA